MNTFVYVNDEITSGVTSDDKTNHDDGDDDDSMSLQMMLLSELGVSCSPDIRHDCTEKKSSRLMLFSKTDSKRSARWVLIGRAVSSKKPAAEFDVFANGKVSTTRGRGLNKR